jgi:hypothetical protein
MILENQQFLNSVHIILLYKSEMIEIPLLLFSLLRKDVTVISMFSLDFSRSGKRETLFGTGVGFKFCHR